MPKPSTKRWGKHNDWQNEIGRKRRGLYLTVSELAMAKELIALDLTDNEWDKGKKYFKALRCYQPQDIRREK